MPEIFINGQPVQARDDQTVMQVARENGFFIPYFCWHPHLSVPGNCRICVVEVEGEGGGGGWLDIACNMPVAKGMRVLTDSPKVQARRKATMQFITLNHPVDCGICDKAGECMLQDHHVAYNGTASVSRDAKVHATKHFALSERVVLDNERCILCTRCVRFTREVSKTHALGVIDRGDHSLIRPVEDGAFERDAYSDNVVDICPVGALLSRRFLHRTRVWMLKKTPSVCPGCSRGCSIDLWHRHEDWKLQGLDAQLNTRVERVTPRENPAVNGPWICNKARDLVVDLARTRALDPMLKGRVVDTAEALQAVGALLRAARAPVALVSNGASNEELSAFRDQFGGRLAAFVKTDRQPEPGEVLQDDLLIRGDKNPNTAGATALFPTLPADSARAFPPGCDLVLVWGEGFDFGQMPAGARIVLLGTWLAPENGHADVFLPIPALTERSGSFTNFQGTTSRFEACFAPPPGVWHVESLFAQMIAAMAAARVAAVPA